MGNKGGLKIMVKFKGYTMETIKEKYFGETLTEKYMGHISSLLHSLNWEIYNNIPKGNIISDTQKENLISIMEILDNLHMDFSNLQVGINQLEETKINSKVLRYFNNYLEEFPIKQIKEDKN